VTNRSLEGEPNKTSFGVETDLFQKQNPRDTR